MKKLTINQFFIIIVATILFSCSGKNGNKNEGSTSEMADNLKKYEIFVLEADISHLSDNEKKVLSKMFEVAEIMDDLFWEEALGYKDEILKANDDEETKKFIEINYGPWDRLDGNKPFLKNVKAKPDGANFYPQDITKKEFEEFKDPNKTSLYTLIRRDENGKLKTVWYHEAFKDKIEKAAKLLNEASELSDNEGLKKYLSLRSKAFLTDEYQESDLAWMDMKTSNIDFVVGPIENYEDKLFGYKAAHEAFILIKDVKWSKRLEKYASMLPELQKQLPVEAKYKSEIPGDDADLNAYDVIYYAGDCNAGSKTIAINLPNDEEVQLQKGSRKLQLKNAMQAKFDKILVPISKVIVTENQRKHITFDAFFGNTMFHEVAHGLGIKNVVGGKGTVRHALKEQYSAIEEGKADILGLYLVGKLFEMGEIESGELMDNYVTFFAGIFRSSRFGAASAHGKANMVRFNFFKEKGAFMKNKDNTYSVNFDKMKEAMNLHIKDLLKLQGDGNYEGAKKLIEEKGVISPELQADLDRINDAGIPVDIVFKQGKSVIGL